MSKEKEEAGGGGEENNTYNNWNNRWIKKKNREILTEFWNNIISKMFEYLAQA